MQRMVYPSQKIAELIEENTRLRKALEQICDRADYIRGLPQVDSYREGLKDAWGEARSIALNVI